MNDRGIRPWYFPTGEEWAYGVSENGEPARGGFVDTEREAQAALRHLLQAEFGQTRVEARRAVRQIYR